MSEHAHCGQVESFLFASGFQSVLQHGHFPRRKYIPRRRGEILSTLHLGQRKLLLSEIGTLLLANPSVQYTVVYAGAAPGIHTPLLSDLFPNMVFHLYDPAPFKIAETDRIKLFNSYFTDNHALLYTFVPNLVFVCDIRRTVDEWFVWEDMLAQQRWHDLMCPVLTSLKFRLPWPGDHGVLEHGNTAVEYLDGDIHFPIWGRQNTTECRLVIEKDRHLGRKRRYDCLVYEEEMCYFNRVIRPSIHRWQRLRFDGLDVCYDCASEVRLLARYAKVWGRSISTASISRELGHGLV